MRIPVNNGTKGGARPSFNKSLSASNVFLAMDQQKKSQVTINRPGGFNKNGSGGNLKNIYSIGSGSSSASANGSWSVKTPVQQQRRSFQVPVVKPTGCRPKRSSSSPRLQALIEGSNTQANAASISSAGIAKQSPHVRPSLSSKSKSASNVFLALDPANSGSNQKSWDKISGGATFSATQGNQRRSIAVAATQKPSVPMMPKRNSSPRMQALMQKAGANANNTRSPVNSKFAMNRSKSPSNVFLANNDGIAANEKWQSSQSTPQPSTRNSGIWTPPPNNHKTRPSLPAGRAPGPQRSTSTRNFNGFGGANKQRPSFARSQSSKGLLSDTSWMKTNEADETKQKIGCKAGTSRQANTEVIVRDGETITRTTSIVNGKRVTTTTVEVVTTFVDEESLCESKAVSVSVKDDDTVTSASSTLGDWDMSDSESEWSEAMDTPEGQEEAEEFKEDDRSTSEDRAARIIQKFFQEAKPILEEHYERKVRLAAKLENIRQRQRVELAKHKQKVALEKKRIFREAQASLEEEIKQDEKDFLEKKRVSLELQASLEEQIKQEKREGKRLEAGMAMQNCSNQKVSRDYLLLQSKMRKLQDGVGRVVGQISPWEDMETKIVCAIKSTRSSIAQVKSRGVKEKETCKRTTRCIQDIKNVLKDRIDLGHVEGGQAACLLVAEQSDFRCMQKARKLVGIQWVHQVLVEGASNRNATAAATGTSEDSPDKPRRQSTSQFDMIGTDDWKIIKKGIKKRRSQRSLFKSGSAPDLLDLQGSSNATKGKGKGKRVSGKSAQKISGSLPGVTALMQKKSGSAPDLLDLHRSTRGEGKGKRVSGKSARKGGDSLLLGVTALLQDKRAMGKPRQKLKRTQSPVPMAA